MIAFVGVVAVDGDKDGKTSPGGDEQTSWAWGLHLQVDEHLSWSGTRRRNLEGGRLHSRQNAGVPSIHPPPTIDPCTVCFRASQRCCVLYALCALR